MKSLQQFLSQTKTRLYRKPKDELQRMARWGPRAYFRCDAWAREMEQAALVLPLIDSLDSQGSDSIHSTPISVWFLTGKRFWYQTAFCAWTLAKYSQRKLVLNLVDDGTLERAHIDGLRRLFPEGVTINKESVQDNLDTLLPLNRFPVLRQRWSDYINIRKLTDVHLGSTGVKLVLDSDMLFFRRPDTLLNWWDGCQRWETGDQRSDIETSDFLPPASSFSPLLMTDCVESYGYSRKLMEELSGAPIPPLLNVGMCGLRSEELDWKLLEHWCQELARREGTSYYLEQALVAMLAAKAAPNVMPRADYITFPTKRQTYEGAGVLQHYVSDSKPWYFGNAWRQALDLSI